jgi:predicted ATP-dependent endonuclease of OLD family
MRFENRRWLVIPTSIIDDIDFNQVHEPNAESLRKSIDESKTFVKYEVNVVEETYTETHLNPETGEEVTNTTEAGTYGRPSIYSEDYTEYNHADILALLATAEWSSTETPE